MPSSHASSEAGSISSGPSPSHGYKKSLSSKADPNTALTEDQPSMQYSCLIMDELAANKDSGGNWRNIQRLPPLHAAHGPRGASHQYVYAELINKKTQC